MEKRFVEAVRTRLLSAQKNHNIKNIKAQDIMALLEHQRMYCETLEDVDSDITSHQFFNYFRQISESLVLNILYGMKTPRLIGFRPILDPLQKTKRHLLKTIIPNASTIQELTQHYGEEMSAQFIAQSVPIVAQSIALEIDQYVLSILRKKTGIIAYVDPSNPNTNFERQYHEMIAQMYIKSGYMSNWVVASSPVANYLSAAATSFVASNEYEKLFLGVRFLGTLNWETNLLNVPNIQQQLYENTFSPDDELLIGYHGNDAPMLQFEPKVLIEVDTDKNQFNKVNQARLKTQFDTNWSDNGELYARMNVLLSD